MARDSAAGPAGILAVAVVAAVVCLQQQGVAAAVSYVLETP